MRISDWSSDVCSSDLQRINSQLGQCSLVHVLGRRLEQNVVGGAHVKPGILRHLAFQLSGSPACITQGNQQLFGPLDRKSAVEGKSVPVRVDLGGRRHIKKNTTPCNNISIMSTN